MAIRPGANVVHPVHLNLIDIRTFEGAQSCDMQLQDPTHQPLPDSLAAWCAPCRFRVAVPLSTDSLLRLIHAPLRPFEPVTLVANLLSADRKPHRIRLIPTGPNAREPRAYVEFAADHEPFWLHRIWISASQLQRPGREPVMGEVQPIRLG